MSNTYQQQIVSQFCQLGEASLSGTKVGVDWHAALTQLTVLIMGYTREGVEAVEALESDAFYKPDFNASATEAREAVQALKGLGATSDGDFLYIAKRRLIRVLKALSYMRVAEMVEDTKSKWAGPERVPRLYLR